jgi:hypothetical protein
MIIQGSRAVGMFSMISGPKVAPVVVRFVSTIGDAPETVTSSVIAPTLSAWSMGALKPATMMMFSRVAFLNPWSSNVTV